MRSRFAHSLSLVRYSAFIAWGGDVRRFPQLILSWSHHGKVAAMMVWRPCVSSPGPSPGPCSRLVPPSRMFLIHPCRSKQEAAAFSIYLGSSSCHRAPSRQIPRPLPVASRFSSRLASRSSSRSHTVSQGILCSSRPVLPDVPHACRRAVLFSSSCRHLPMSCRPHRLITG